MSYEMLQRLRAMPEADRNRLMEGCAALLNGIKRSKDRRFQRNLESMSHEEAVRLQRRVVALFRRANMHLVAGGKKDVPSDDLKGDFNL
jgi:hypothetical protein